MKRWVYVAMGLLIGLFLLFLTRTLFAGPDDDIIGNWSSEYGTTLIVRPNGDVYYGFQGGPLIDFQDMQGIETTWENGKILSVRIGDESLEYEFDPRGQELEVTIRSPYKEERVILYRDH